MPNQQIMMADADYTELDAYLVRQQSRRVLLVCDSSLPFLKLSRYFDALPTRLGIQVIPFNRFTPNPLYESVVEGVEVFRQNRCDTIIAVGGGSAMDVAKCIKLYSGMDAAQNYLTQTIIPNDVPLLAVPTTAGTGSEATRYAVIYFEGNKQSVSHDSCIPSTVLFDASTLKTLPEYQKKSTMMDALCHAMESYWSVHATVESQAYAKAAIELILANQDTYLKNEETGNANMLQAANLAGKAINVTQTTAGHAMCYKLTSLYGIAHGHAAALCVSKLFPYMIGHTELCVDPRGASYLESVFAQLADAMGCKNAKAAAEYLNQLLRKLELRPPTASAEDYAVLVQSVNTTRLKNNPVNLDTQTITNLYAQIVNQDVHTVAGH